jgi:hypothetical protein
MFVEANNYHAYSCSLSISSISRQCCCLADGANVPYNQPLLQALGMVPVATIKGSNAIFILVLLLRDSMTKFS